MNSDQEARLATMIRGDWAAILGDLGPDEIETFTGSNGPGETRTVTFARFGTREVTAIADSDNTAAIGHHDHDTESDAHECYSEHVEHARQELMIANITRNAVADAMAVINGTAPALTIPEPDDPRWRAPGPMEV